MREIHIGPGKVAQVMVEEDADGRRVLLRIGNGRIHPLRPIVADALGDLLKHGAAECRTPAERPPTITRPSEAAGQLDALHHQV
jgi:hypothetical protein